MATKNKVCYCCGNAYSFCPSCNSSAPTWRNLFDTEECNKVFRVISNYNTGKATADDVKAVVETYNIKDFSKFKDSIACQLTNAVSAKDATSEIVDEASVPLEVETNTIDNTDEKATKTINKKTTKINKGYKKNIKVEEESSVE